MGSFGCSYYPFRNLKSGFLNEKFHLNILGPHYVLQYVSHYSSLYFDLFQYDLCANTKSQASPSFISFWTRSMSSHRTFFCVVRTATYISRSVLAAFSPFKYFISLAIYNIPAKCNFPPKKYNNPSMEGFTCSTVLDVVSLAQWPVDSVLLYPVSLGTLITILTPGL